LKYNKFYVGLAREGQVDNFVTFRLRKNHIVLRFSPQSDDTDAKINEAGLEYSVGKGRYRIRLEKDDIGKHADLLKQLMHQAYDMKHK
jgi:hypothetical protein